jgi:hypothetical protein
MIRVHFMHQNPPGQLRPTIRYVRARPGRESIAIGAEAAVRRECPGKLPHGAGPHGYLMYPFVRSWSMLEAMAPGTPLRDAIRAGAHRFLASFFDTVGLPAYPAPAGPLPAHMEAA